MASKTSIKSLFGLPIIIAGLGVIPTALVMAQTLTVLHTFTANEGAGPNGLVLSGNILYGTTKYGSNFYLGGTVFAVKTNGTGFTNLYSYSGGSDGFFLNGGLILSSNSLFGTSQYGGIGGSGTIFAINTDAPDFTPLHSFTGNLNDGAYPLAGVILFGNIFMGHPPEAAFQVLELFSPSTPRALGLRISTVSHNTITLSTTMELTLLPI